MCTMWFAGRHFNQKRKFFTGWFCLRLNKRNKETLCLCGWPWRTLPLFELQTVLWGLYFPLKPACLFCHGKKSIYLSLDFFSKTAHCPFKEIILEIRKKGCLYGTSATHFGHAPYADNTTTTANATHDYEKCILSRQHYTLWMSVHRQPFF